LPSRAVNGELQHLMPILRQLSSSEPFQVNRHFLGGDNLIIKGIV
jgi:hypothetical protein